jgi:integrase
MDNRGGGDRDRGDANNEAHTAIDFGTRTALGDEVFAWDDDLPGFGIRVKPSGHKSFLIQYREGRRTRRVTLGACTVFRLEEARERARRMLVAAKDGKGPAAERDAARTALTVRELSERYLTEHAAERKTPRSLAEDRRNIDNHVVPLLGRLLVKDVSRTDIERFMIRVRAGATACDEKIGPRARRIVRGGPIAANRCYALLSKMMNLAERWGIRPDGSNPCRHVERNRERRRERFLSAGELGRLGKTLAEAEHTATESASVIAAIRLLIFTGARRSEILTARWEHFDEENRCLRLPDSKTGAKVLHLNPPALEVLASLPRDGNSPWIVRARDPNRSIVDLEKPWQRIRAKAGLLNVRIHDLRHSFASVAAADGLSLPIIGALLGHSQPATTARYAHFAADPLRQAVDLIGSRIAAAMQGEKGPGGATIRIPARSR